MKKNIFIFTVLSFVAKIFAFGRELFLTYYYGANVVSDVFLLSMTLPVNIFGFISAGITSGFIPIYHNVKEKEGKERALQFCSQVTNIIVTLCLIFIVVYYLLSDKLLRIFAMGFDDATMEMAINFTNISIWAIISIALTAVFTSYLQINNRINVTAVSQIPQNIGIVITIILSVFFRNSMILPTGFLISSLCQTLFLLFFCIKEDYRYSFNLSIKDKHVKRFVSGLGMLTVSSSILQINSLVDRTLATKVMVGGLSMFEYAGNVNNLFMGLTIIPFSTALFPQMTKCANDKESFSNIFFEGTKLFVIIMVPLTLFICGFSREIVGIIYGRGAFGEQETYLTSGIVVYYSIGLLAYAVRELLSKAFYASGDVKTPMINSSIALALNIVLNLVLIKVMGLNGLAAATTISAYIMTLLLFRAIRKKIDMIGIKSMLCSLGISIGASGVCLIPSRLLFNVTYEAFSQRIISMIVGMIVFGIVYFVLAMLTGLIKISWIKSIFTKSS